MRRILIVLHLVAVACLSSGAAYDQEQTVEPCGFFETPDYIILTTGEMQELKPSEASFRIEHLRFSVHPRSQAFGTLMSYLRQYPPLGRFNHVDVSFVKDPANQKDAYHLTGTLQHDGTEERYGQFFLKYSLGEEKAGELSIQTNDSCMRAGLLKFSRMTTTLILRVRSGT